MRTMSKNEFRRALESLGMTQAAGAEFLGVSTRSAHGWANGAEIPISVQKLLRTVVNNRIEVEQTEIPIPAE